MNVIYNFLICSFLFETRSWNYAIKQEVTVLVTVTHFRLCYTFKNPFSSIRYCIGKTMHMKAVYGAVRGED